MDADEDDAEVVAMARTFELMARMDRVAHARELHLDDGGNLPYLAAKLYELAYCLADEGGRAEALPLAREAVEHYQVLTRADPEFGPDAERAGRLLTSLDEDTPRP